MLPAVLPSSGIFGETDPEFFGGSITMAGDAGDQQAATFGQPASSRAWQKILTELQFHVDEYRRQGYSSQHGLLTTLGLGRGRQENPQVTYALEGSIFTQARLYSGCAMACVLSKIASM